MSMNGYLQVAGVGLWDKIHMFILVHAEKSFDKSNTPFMFKLLEASVINLAYLNKIKVIYDKPIDNNNLNVEKLKIRDYTMMPAYVRDFKKIYQKHVLQW